MKHLAAVCLLLLTVSAAQAGTISMTWTEGATTGNASTVTKTYTVADGDMDKIVVAYQQAANTSINGVATRNQVLLYWISTVLVAPTQSAVQSNLTTPPIVPVPINFQ